MRFTLEIIMKNTEGVLERVLGKLRQRNLNIQAMNACCSADLANIEAKITVDSKTDVESISKQLAKLYDVQSINVFALELNNACSQSSDTSPLMESTMRKSLGGQNAISLPV